MRVNEASIEMTAPKYAFLQGSHCVVTKNKFDENKKTKDSDGGLGASAVLPITTV